MRRQAFRTATPARRTLQSARSEAATIHPERIEDVRFRIPIEPLAAHPPDDVAEEEEVDIAVDEAFAGWRRRHFLDGAADRLVSTMEFHFELEIRPQARGVRHQVTDGDRGLVELAEPGHELRDRIAQPDLSLLDELHHAGRRRDDFRERREIEDGVLGHRLRRRRDGALTERAAIGDRITAADQHHRAGQLVPRDRGLDERRDRRETGR